MRSEPDPAGIAAEFGLGRVLGAEPLPGGHRGAFRLITSGGTFVVKPESDPAVAELYEKAALVLSAAGIRQATPLRTVAGSLVSASGLGVEEFLPGGICLAPTAAQAAAAMRHVTDYHAALATLPAAAGLAIYVASSDLLPEVQKEPGWKSTLAIGAGLGLFLVSTHFLPHP